MSDNETTAGVSLEDFSYEDTAEMTVMLGGRPTAWKWRFAGPAHPMGQAQQKRVSAENLHKSKLQEQSQVNRKKWKAEEQSPDEVHIDNVNFVMERLLGWNEMKFKATDAEPYAFSSENARAILNDPKFGQILQQAVDFIIDDNSFTRRSLKN